MGELSLPTIQELQEIVRTDYGKELSLEETGVIARGLVSYFNKLAEVYHMLKIDDRDPLPTQEADRGH